MGKAELGRFSKEENEVARLAKALSHPARVAIMRHLAKTQGCICGDLVEVLPLAQATVSQHLRELRKAGLISGEVEGASICYCVNKKEWERAARLIESLFTKISMRCC